MIVLVFIACLAFGTAAAFATHWALSRWWPEPVVDLTEPERLEVEQCEVCSSGLVADEVHRVSTLFDDDVTSEASPLGATGMSAFYCEAHCPGGCQREKLNA